MNIITQFFKKNGSSVARTHEIHQDLMRREIELTRDIFGPVPKGVDRQFFCLDKNTWIWYEGWTDKKGIQHKVTTRYIVRPSGVIKSQNNGAYHRLSFDESKNFNRAVNLYYDKVKHGLYA